MDAPTPQPTAENCSATPSKRNGEAGQALDAESRLLTPGYRVPPLRNRRQCARFVATLLRAGARGHISLEAMNRLIAGAQVLQGMYGDLEVGEEIAKARAEMEMLVGRLAPNLTILGHRPAITGIARRDDE